MRLGVDVGGTFTDLVAWDQETGRVAVSKALNDVPGTTKGVSAAIAQAGLAPDSIDELIHGTTMVTNLLIERNAGPIGLICSEGFRDLLEIQLSWRERTFDLTYRKTAPLIPRRLRQEVAGRMGGDGTERVSLDRPAVAAAARRLIDMGVEAIVVSLYNAYANPEHERQAAEVVRGVDPNVVVTLATDVDPRIGEYHRLSTAVLNAMAVPKMRSYASSLGSIVEFPIFYMHSAGGMLPAKEATDRPVQLAFSGPAAGVLAGRSVARSLGFDNAITMDMGGTSCDVCLIWDGELQYKDQIDVDWGVPARVRSLAVHTVGAGGGSIAWQDEGGALRVGPLSAGATPGPACYGRGGMEPTVTDANVVLGILSSEAGLCGGQLALDLHAASKALGGLSQSFDVTVEELALAVHRMVNANMAQAIREITVRQGIDPRDCALVAFGGAGGQHAIGVADELGITSVVVPSNASVLSATGLLIADLQVNAQETMLLPVEELGSSEAAGAFDRLAREAADRLEIVPGTPIQQERFAAMRYVAQSHEIVVPVGENPDETVETFEVEHERLFGTRLGDPVEVVDLHVTLTVRSRDIPEAAALIPAVTPREEPLTSRFAHIEGQVIDVYDRSSLRDGTQGPCLVEEDNSVVLVPSGVRVATADPHIVLERIG